MLNDPQDDEGMNIDKLLAKWCSQILTRTGERRYKMLDWLSTVPFSRQQHHHSSNRHPGTGKWLLQKEDFVKWEHSSSSLLFWLCGAGKSNVVPTISH